MLEHFISSVLELSVACKEVNDLHVYRVGPCPYICTRAHCDDSYSCILLAEELKDAEKVNRSGARGAVAWTAQNIFISMTSSPSCKVNAPQNSRPYCSGNLKAFKYIRAKYVYHYLSSPCLAFAGLS
jgi:hypothetical protein